MADVTQIAKDADRALQSASRALRSETGMLLHGDIAEALRHAEAACAKLTFLETIARGVPEPKGGD